MLVLRVLMTSLWRAIERRSVYSWVSFLFGTDSETCFLLFLFLFFLNFVCAAAI